jgi:hypothetical protein
MSSLGIWFRSVAWDGGKPRSAANVTARRVIVWL